MSNVVVDRQPIEQEAGTTVPPPVDEIVTDVDMMKEQDSVSIISFPDDSTTNFDDGEDGLVVDETKDMKDDEISSNGKQEQEFVEEEEDIPLDGVGDDDASTSTVSFESAADDNTKKMPAKKSVTETTNETLIYLASKLTMADPKQVLLNLSTGEETQVEDGIDADIDIGDDDIDDLSPEDPMKILLQALSNEENKQDEIYEEDLLVPDNEESPQEKEEDKESTGKSAKSEEDRSLSFRASDVSSMEDSNSVVADKYDKEVDAQLMSTYSLLGREDEEPEEEEDIKAPVPEDDIFTPLVSTTTADEQVEVTTAVATTTKAVATAETKTVPVLTEPEDPSPAPEHDLDVLVTIGNKLLQDVADTTTDAEEIATSSKFLGIDTPSRKTKVTLSLLFGLAAIGTTWIAVANVGNSHTNVDTEPVVSSQKDGTEILPSSIQSMPSTPLPPLIELNISLSSKNTQEWVDELESDDIPVISQNDTLMIVEATANNDEEGSDNEKVEMTLPMDELKIHDSQEILTATAIPEEDDKGSHNEEQQMKRDDGKPQGFLHKLWGTTKALMIGMLVLQFISMSNDNSSTTTLEIKPEDEAYHVVAANNNFQQENEEAPQAWDLSNYEKLKVVELRAILKARKCKVVGRKHVLIERLVNVYAAELETLTVMQLRPLLKKKGCKQAGRKVELIRRLVEAGMD